MRGSIAVPSEQREQGIFCPKLSTFNLSTVDSHLHSSSPALRNFASNVFGDTPNFSDARVLFHLHSRKVLSSSTRSMWPTARPVTSSRRPFPTELLRQHSRRQAGRIWFGRRQAAIPQR